MFESEVESGVEPEEVQAREEEPEEEEAGEKEPEEEEARGRSQGK